VAVDGGAVADVEFAGDHFGAAPVEEVALDGLAVRMVADGAAASVMGRIGLGLGGFDFGGCGGLGGGSGARGGARVNIGVGRGVNEIGIVFAFAMVRGVILAFGWMKVAHAH